jgi:hypothetical protein
VELISDPVAWERLTIIVAVEDPIRHLLRISDGHVPNLTSIARGYDLARIKCTAVIATAEEKYPAINPGLNDGKRTW